MAETRVSAYAWWAEGAGVEPGPTVAGRGRVSAALWPGDATTLRRSTHTSVTYPLAVHAARPLLVAVVAALLLVAGVGASDRSNTSLRLDGASFRPELALTSAQRQRGLMQRRKAPVDGMLFVFPYATSGGFWMKNTLVPLRIVFYDSRGRAVRTMTMTPCREDPCKIYDPQRQYRFALELRAKDPRSARRLGPSAELARLIRAAS